MRMSIELDVRDVKRFATDVQKKYVPAAAGIALKRVGTTVRNRASKKIRQRIAISSSVAKDALTIKRTGQGLTLWIVASGKPIALRDYQARQTTKGTTYRVSKIGSRKVYARQGRKGFILPKRGGHVFVAREDDPPGPQRARIKKVFGPSVPQYFVTKPIVEEMDKTGRERWPIEFANALRGVLLRKTGVDIGKR